VSPFKSVLPSNDVQARVSQSAPAFRVVHNFGNGDDGYFPSASMIAINGTLYGVTAEGGAYGSQPQYGGGTVFNLNAAGDEHVIYSFNPGQFYAPQGKLLFLNNSFYGTTSGGGKNGAGSVFTVGKNGTGR